MPQKGRFLSRVFSFHFQPNQAMLELSEKNPNASDLPTVGADRSLQDSLNALFTFYVLRLTVKA